MSDSFIIIKANDIVDLVESIDIFNKQGWHLVGRIQTKWYWPWLRFIKQARLEYMPYKYIPNAEPHKQQQRPTKWHKNPNM